jgi:hypothetical protein
MPARVKFGLGQPSRARGLEGWVCAEAVRQRCGRSAFP